MHVESTRLARLRTFELSPTAFRRLAALTGFALWLIVATGAVVRLTGSGLGCEHWPGCQPGQPFPEKDYHSFIEFGNRAVGGVTIALTLALAIGARFTRGLPDWTRKLAIATFVGALAQAPLGAITVYAHLHPALVIPHLLLSMAVLGAAVVVGLEALALGRGHGEPLDREPRIAGIGIGAACFGLLATGTLATAAGPHSGGTRGSWRGSPARYRRLDLEMARAALRPGHRHPAQPARRRARPWGRPARGAHRRSRPRGRPVRSCRSLYSGTRRSARIQARQFRVHAHPG